MKQELTENSVLKIAGQERIATTSVYDARNPRLDFCRWWFVVNNYEVIVEKYEKLDGTYEHPYDWKEQNKTNASCKIRCGVVPIGNKVFTETVYEEDVISFIKETIRNHMEKTSDLARWVYDQEI